MPTTNLEPSCIQELLPSCIESYRNTIALTFVFRYHLLRCDYAQIIRFESLIQLWFIRISSVTDRFPVSNISGRSSPERLARPEGSVHESGQISQGSFSAVSKPISKVQYPPDSFRQDLHRTVRSQVFKSFDKFCHCLLLVVLPNIAEFWQMQACLVFSDFRFHKFPTEKRKK